MSRQFFKDRIAVTEAEIIAVEEAMTALVSGGVQSYTLDTGQQVQTVTKFDIGRLRATLDSLYNRLATLEARVYGAAITARPAW